MTYNTRAIMTPTAIIKDVRHQPFSPTWCDRRALMVCDTLMDTFRDLSHLGGPHSICTRKAWGAPYDELVRALATPNLRLLDIAACIHLYHTAYIDPHVWLVLPASLLTRCALHDDARWQVISSARRIYLTPDAHLTQAPQLTLF
jgi:hypothetical protein